MNRWLDRVNNMRLLLTSPKSSLIFLRAVITVSFAPVVLLVATWCYAFYFHVKDPWVFTMMDYAIKIIDHIWTAQVVAGVMAYGTALIDDNGNGIPDEFEKGNRK